jgi:hypothetical protein
MKIAKTVVQAAFVASAFLCAASLTACEEKPKSTPDAIRDAGERAEDAAKEAGDKMEDAADDAADKLEGSNP